MSFKGDEGERVTLEEAAAMTKRYRDNSPEGSIISHFIGMTHFKDILEQADCVGIRMYHALDASDVKQIVLVGVDADENDLHEGILVDRNVLCPPRCPQLNPLNSDESI